MGQNSTRTKGEESRILRFPGESSLNIKKTKHLKRRSVKYRPRQQKGGGEIGEKIQACKARKYGEESRARRKTEISRAGGR